MYTTNNNLTNFSQLNEELGPTRTPSILVKSNLATKNCSARLGMCRLKKRKHFLYCGVLGWQRLFGGGFPSWAASASSEMSRVICDAISMCACSIVIVILMFIPKTGGTIVEPFSWLLHLISFFIQLAQLNQTKIWRGGLALHLDTFGQWRCSKLKHIPKTADLPW